MNPRGSVVTGIAAIIVLMLVPPTNAAEILLDRQILNFNDDWRFAKGSQPGAEKVDFDDSAWQAVRLPHDWAISGPFNPSENGYAGKLPWKGEGWYRKTFALDKAADGRRVQLYGVCLHHDQGPLGAAFYPRAMERQLEIMRDMGVNAARTSHNPPAPELLDLCDRMGFVVWDEAFDKWDGTADRVRGEPPLEQYGEKQIRNLVMRDRHHPCVVVWSIGNKLGGGRDGITPERVKFMSGFVRKYDPTRPVGMACHIPGLAEQPNFDALDLTGWNYARRYATYRQRYPDKPIIYSESASALSTRGFYDLPLPNEKTQYSRQLQVDSYDLNAAAWSDIADALVTKAKQDVYGRPLAGRYY